MSEMDSGLAYRYTGWLESSFVRSARLPDRAREARRFYRLGQRQKLERIAALQQGGRNRADPRLDSGVSG